MNWTVLAIAWMAAWSACLVWFVLLVVRRARSPQKKSMPLWGRIGELVIDGVALPVLLLNAGLTGAWVPLRRGGHRADAVDVRAALNRVPGHPGHVARSRLQRIHPRARVLQRRVVGHPLRPDRHCLWIAVHPLGAATGLRLLRRRTVAWLAPAGSAILAVPAGPLRGRTRLRRAQSPAMGASAAATGRGPGRAPRTDVLAWPSLVERGP